MSAKERRSMDQAVAGCVRGTKEGIMLPQFFAQTDAHVYAIDRVLNCVLAPALKAGRQGDQYKVELQGKIRYIFFEHNCDYGSANLGALVHGMEG